MGQNVPGVKELVLDAYFAGARAFMKDLTTVPFACVAQRAREEAQA